MPEASQTADRPSPSQRTRAAICTRVSTADQVRGTSLDTQMDECLAYARTRGLIVVGEYVDGGVSGKWANRPGLDRLMADCRAAKVDVVIVAKHDRFGRSFRHTITLIGELEELNVEFVSIAERIDDTPAGRFQRNVLLSVAEFERERILERTTAGIERTALEGRWPTGGVPFGWKLTRDDRNGPKVVIDPAGAAVWERITELLVDRGLSTLAAARELNAAGIRSRKGATWSASSLNKLVRDAHALDGNWVYRREGRRWAKPGDGPPIKIEIPAILTPERFAALQSAIGRRSRTRKTWKRLSLLSGRLESACGQPMWVMTKHNGVRYYRCRAKFAPDGGGAARTNRCGCHNVDANAIEEHVWSAVAEALSDPPSLVSLAAEQAQTAATAAGLSDQDVAALDRRIARLEKAASTALADALAQGIDMAVAAGAVKTLQAELGDARDRRRQLAAWAATAAELDGRARTLNEIAAETAEAFALRPFGDSHRRVVDALEVTVTVMEWAVCENCHGSGRAIGVGRGRICELCVGHGSFPVLRIGGHLPRISVSEPAWPITLATRTSA